MDDRKLVDGKKKLQPLQYASAISNILFWWAIPLFYKRYKNEVTEEEYFETLPNLDSNKLGDKLEQIWMKQKKTAKPSLWKALMGCFGLQFCVPTLLHLFNTFVLKFSQPLLIGKLMVVYQDNEIKSMKSVYIYSSLIVLISFLNVVIAHNFMMQVSLFGMKIRIACCSLIYRKILRLHKSSLVDNNIGKIINLLSNDVRRFDMAPMHFLQLCIAPFEVLLIMYSLFVNVGWTAIAGILFLLIFVPVQIYMGKLTANYRGKMATQTDQRIKIMSEIVAGIQVIKMYTWEKGFAKFVEKTRSMELNQLRFASYLKAINVSLMICLNRTGIFLCIILYAIYQDRIDARYVFLITSYYAVLRQTLTVHIPFGISSTQETRVSVERILKFLLSDEVLPRETITYIPNKINGHFEPVESQISEKPKIFMEDVIARWDETTVLKNVNFSAMKEEHVGIIGPVGSGKSTFLQIILNEVEDIQGYVEVHGKISYAAQEPWLFSASIRQNIIFGEEFEEEKYWKVLEVCSLSYDLQQLPFGDKTKVGDKGVLLSGGQKARINLARAVYKEADIYLLDDPLSAVDPQVSRDIFQNCIQDYLKEKCIILVTHQLQYLHSLDKVYFVDKNTIELMDTEETSISSYLRESENTESDIDSNSTDQNEKVENTLKSPKENQEQKESGAVSKIVYKKYLRACSGPIIIFLLMLLFILTQLGASGLDYYVGFWVNLQQMNYPYFNFDLCIYIYTSILIFTIIVTITRTITFFNICLTGSKKLHNKMFERLLKAPLYFFNTNPAGRILNRFSKDLGLIDEDLPRTAMDTIQIALIVGGLILVLGILNPWMLIPASIILIISYFFRIIFLTSSRNLKRSEAIAKSPVLSYTTATVQGLTTIRVSGSEKLLRSEFDNYQNLQTSMSFMFLFCNRAFAFWLDFICVIFSIIVVATVVLKESLVGNIGVAITQVISLTGVFQWGIRQWSELENQMTSVERIVEYSELPPEKDCPDNKLKNWPKYGEIQYKSVTFRYSESAPLILFDVNFHIKSKEKIGIIGRTGAGKSSLISALFRFGEVGGEIIIDDWNTKEISLNILRSSISIIPQNPVLFSGKLRDNLDFGQEFSDDQIWNALERVNLKDLVASHNGGISMEVQEGGSNFSVGQRQLICLARAVLRKNKILILDEATANVDPTTDNLIQAALRLEFQECTVLTIAHRINTIIDSDRVLVMDHGQIIEFDYPWKLLRNQESVFSHMVDNTGEEMSGELRKIAENNSPRKYD